MTKTEGDHYAAIAEFDQNLRQTINDIREKAAKEQASINEEKQEASADLNAFKDKTSNDNRMKEEEFDLSYNQKRQEDTLAREKRSEDIGDADFENRKIIN